MDSGPQDKSVDRSTQRVDVFSCFYHIGGGKRCNAPCPPPVFHCATHIHAFYSKSPSDLLTTAAEDIVASTRFADDGLPHLSCKDFERWGSLANTFAALTFYGYRDEQEILSMLLSSLLALNSPWKDRLSSLPPRWKAFERLVARLYLEELAPLIRAVRPGGTTISSEGVRVLWNQEVPSTITDDRQVDVLIRWFRGHYGEVFTIIECKDYDVPVKEVEAFVTKIKHLGAHNGVMVSTVGFQSGAKDVAAAFDIELRVVTEDTATVQPVAQALYRYRLRPAGVYLEPPITQAITELDQPASTYHVIVAGEDHGTLEAVIESTLESVPPMLLAWPPRAVLETPEGRLRSPGGQEQEIARIKIILALEQRLESARLERPRSAQSFSITDILKRTERLVGAAAVPLIPVRFVEPAKFYMSLLCQVYYAKATEGNLVTLILLADLQHATTLDVEFVQEQRETSSYYPVEDPVVLERFTAALERYKRLPGQEGQW